MFVWTHMVDVVDAHGRCGAQQCTMKVASMRIFLTALTLLSQNWADNFISELNDTHIEADLRMRHAPPPVRLFSPCHCSVI